MIKDMLCVYASAASLGCKLTSML